MKAPWRPCTTLLVAVLAAGCSTAARNADPFQALEGAPTNPALRALTAGVVISSKSNMTLEKLRQKVVFGIPMMKDPNQTFTPTIDVLKRSFGRTDRFASIEEAFASRPDVVAVLDVTVGLGMHSGQQTITDISVDFFDRERRLIESVGAQGKRKIPWPAHTFAVAESAAAAAEAFAARLATAPALSAYARSTPQGGVASSSARPQAPAPARMAAIEAPAFRLPEDPSKFALVIGIESYSEVVSAPHAVRDAEAVRSHLLAMGYPERNVVFLADQKAGKSAFEKYLEAWLPLNTDEKSSVLVYFSGHGAPSPASGEAYLVPWDGDPRFIDTTGYGVKRLYAKLNALKAARVLVALDACFSGAGGRSVIAAGTRPLVGKIDTGASGAGRVGALTASAADETTGTLEVAGHGLFTYHLLKGLQARGGKATLSQLLDYLSPKVRDAARRDNRDQTPQLLGDGGLTF